MSPLPRLREQLIETGTAQRNRAAQLFTSIRQYPCDIVQQQPVVRGGKRVFTTYQTPFVVLPEAAQRLDSGQTLRRFGAVSLKLWYAAEKSQPRLKRSSTPLPDGYSFVAHPIADSRDSKHRNVDSPWSTNGRLLPLLPNKITTYDGIFPPVSYEGRHASPERSWAHFLAVPDEALTSDLTAYHQKHLENGKRLLEGVVRALENRQLNPRSAAAA